MMKLRFLLCLLLLNVFFAAFAQENVTRVEVEVEEVSAYPAQKELAYPDCLAAVSCRVNLILDGEATTEQIECLFPVYTDYRENKTWTAHFQKGQKLFLEIKPLDAMDEKTRQTQQANDLSGFAVQQYYVTNVKRLREFSPISFPVSFADKARYTSLWDNSLNPPQDAAVWAARERRMQEQQEDIQKALSVINDNSQMFSLSGKDLLEKNNLNHVFHRLFNLDIAFFRNKSGLFCLSPQYHPFEKGVFPRESLDSIGKLNQFFLNQQIQFFVVIVPDFTAIAARALASEYQYLPDAKSYMLADEFNRRNVETLILAPQIQNEIPDRELIFNYHNFDSHPGPGAADIGGRAMANILKAIGIVPNETGTSLENRVETVQYPEWIQKELGIKEYHIEKVFSKNAVLSLNDNVSSPVLMIGNSFTRSPQGASFGHRMALYSGVVPDLLKIEGNSMAAVIPKRLLLNAERYLKGKKICFMILTPAFLNYNWADVQAWDRLYAATSDAVEVSRFSIRDLQGSEALEELPFTSSLPGLQNENPSDWHVYAGGKKFDRPITIELPASVLPSDAGKERFLLLQMSSANVTKITIGKQAYSLYAAKDSFLIPLDETTAGIQLELKSTEKWAIGPIQILEKEKK